MIEKLKNFKKIEIILVVLLAILFFVSRANIINYGLPFFQQEDEGAFLKSTLSFIGFISGFRSELNDPVVAPFINLLLTLTFLFFNEFILNSLSLTEINQKIYNDPSILIIYGRYISLTITTLCIFLLYLIFKKFKINFLIYFPLLISIAFSIFNLPISLVNGKNSYYLFFFLLQLYFLIKYYFKSEKFNKNSYLLFSILASLAWGINYWSSIVSIYGVLILHYKKFKFKNFKYLFYFTFVFIIFGFLPNLLGQEIFIDFFKIGNDVNDFSIVYFFENMVEKILFSFQIVLNTERLIVVYFLLFIFYLFKNFRNKNIIVLLSILFIEPILIIALAAQVTPELRYFSGIICLIFILSALILKDLSDHYNSKLVILIFALINIGVIVEKTIIYNKLNNIFSSDHTFVNFYEKNKSINSDTLYLIPKFDTRKNSKNLNFYKALHEKNIIKNKLFQKDNYDAILKKIQLEKNSDIRLKNKIILDLNLFNMNLFDIDSYEQFFNEVEKKYKFVSIQENGLESIDLYNYIKTNYYNVATQYNDKDLYYYNGLRDIIKYLYNGGSEKKLNNFVLGNNYSLYRLNDEN